MGPWGAEVHCSQIHNGGRRVISGVEEASLFCVSQAVFRATGRPSSCSFEGRYAPRSPNPRTNNENTVPTTANRRSTRVEATRRAQTFKLLAWREELRNPWSPVSTPRFDVPPEQRSWSRNVPLVASQCVAPGWPVGLHPAAQVRRVHSVKKRRPHSNSNSCLLPRGTTRPRKPATLLSAVQAVGVPAVVCVWYHTDCEEASYKHVALTMGSPIWNMEVQVISLEKNTERKWEWDPSVWIWTLYHISTLFRYHITFQLYSDNIPHFNSIQISYHISTLFRQYTIFQLYSDIISHFNSIQTIYHISTLFRYHITFQLYSVNIPHFNSIQILYHISTLFRQYTTFQLYSDNIPLFNSIQISYHISTLFRQYTTFQLYSDIISNFNSIQTIYHISILSRHITFQLYQLISLLQNQFAVLVPRTNVVIQTNVVVNEHENQQSWHKMSGWNSYYNHSRCRQNYSINIKDNFWSKLYLHNPVMIIWMCRKFYGHFKIIFQAQDRPQLPQLSPVF